MTEPTPETPATPAKSGVSNALVGLIFAVLIACGVVVGTIVVIHNQDVATQQAKDKAAEQDRLSAELHAWAYACQAAPGSLGCNDRDFQPGGAYYHAPTTVGGTR
jgi:outer membrane murein-binding lipoprotein Lpp